MREKDIICFDNWDTYSGLSEGSGRSVKKWLINRESKKIGLFKFNKSNDTTEHVSENLASDLANILKIPCVQTDLGIYNSKYGSMNYLINEKNEDLIEGINLIEKTNPNFDSEILFDPVLKEKYSIEMCKNALNEYEFLDDFYRMLTFDYLIGNSDRHQSNWAILKYGEEVSFCPLYDHSSSLCSYVNDCEKIDRYLGNDKILFNSLVDNKSESIIRIYNKENKKPKHSDVLKYISTEKIVRETIEQFSQRFDEFVINDLLNSYNEKVIPENKRKLISKYLLWKIGKAQILL
ncbi:MAG: hypothetical protein PWP16_779 [Eubacteriaceae bacterium]|nr:hypothetical protein [Eubacteriaceae bacterium]MDK2904951.1 hypothetical protein [Eubacteriaceae bacterium]MDK2937038.1 hypothetical protein [Eubacteriaceae bacterium]MDK2962370.1 hypothetical protein [Eubacteriaceae bacterium]MDN5307416.1 hypothetical protein [Eubacteriaceae bacterium]